MPAVADWRKPNEYPKGARVSLRRWAWEFLRRNPAYQADWLAYAETCREILPSWTPGEAFADDPAEALRLHDLLHEDERFKAYEPARLPGEREAAWVVRVEKGRIVPLDKWYGAKYGLRNFANPFSEYRASVYGGPDFEAVPRTLFVLPGWEGFKGAPTISGNRFRAIGIDLALPIEPQLRDAQAALERAQARLIEDGAIEKWPDKRNRHAEWPYLLRILDAKAAGATLAEMAAELYPHLSDGYPDFAGRKAAEKRLKSAESMASEGYRCLPMLRK